MQTNKQTDEQMEKREEERAGGRIRIRIYTHTNDRGIEWRIEKKPFKMCQLSQGVSPVHNRQTPFDGEAFRIHNAECVCAYRVKWVNVLNDDEDLVSLNPNMSVIIINGFTTVAVVMSYQHSPLNFQTRSCSRSGIHTYTIVCIECVHTNRNTVAQCVCVCSMLRHL